jgi:hypothetical protein
MESAPETLPLVEEYRQGFAGWSEIVPFHSWQEAELGRRKRNLTSQSLADATGFRAALPAGALVAPEVEDDLAKVFRWYEALRPGRAEEFLDCVRAGLRAVCRNPSINPVLSGSVRRSLLQPFPFAAFYEIADGKVILHGVLTINSNPKKWQPPIASAPGNRTPQVVLILSLLLGSWLGMQIVHEFGHVLGGWLTGGQVARVVLHPLTISRTDWLHNPHPLVEVWAGPILGVLLPLAGWLMCRGRRGAYLMRFFAGFCCIANGAYIAGGSFDRLGDAGDLLRFGAPMWLLWLFGLVTIPLGLWLWHRQGPFFGLGPAKGKVSTRAAYGTLAAVIMVIILELLLGGE